jgi:hypothetical protein
VSLLQQIEPGGARRSQHTAIHTHTYTHTHTGEFRLRKVRRVPHAVAAAAGAGRGGSGGVFFWRFSFDVAACTVLTDRPVTDLVVE